jgi:hypothetical protein
MNNVNLEGQTQMSTITISDLNADNFLSDLTADEIELIQGGDLWDILKEGWTDFKQGLVDGWNGN